METRETVYVQRVEFGDCDPARIVWFPNFFRWIDAASRHFFMEHGVAPWYETEATRGIIGTPLVDTRARFVKTASYGDTLHIRTHVAEWREKSFVMRHRVERPKPEGEVDLIMECEEVRIFAARRDPADGASSIRAIPIPHDIRALCS